MAWYYLNESGEVVGPVSAMTLKELNSVGVLKPETQVCREGTEVWISLHDSLGADTAAVGPSWRPWVVSLAPDHGASILAVSFPDLDDERFSQIIALAETYEKCADRHMIGYLSHDTSRRALYFDFGTDGQPSPLHSSQQSFPEQDRILAIADLLITCAGDLHSRQLGIWNLNDDSFWKCGSEILLIPSFWVPVLSADERAQVHGLPPELGVGPIRSDSAVAADIFAISQRMFWLLTGTLPSGPSPQMDDLRKLGLEAWEPFLDAGLRARPERRPQTLGELGGLVPSSLRPAQGPGVRRPNPVSPHGRSSKTTGSSSPSYTPKKERNDGGRGRRSLLILGAGIALVVGLMIVKAILFKNGAAGLSSSGYKRGFGDTILQYPDRSYESSSWKEVYSNKRLLPADAIFERIIGWDDDTFTIFGGIQHYPGGSGTLIVQHRDQEWTWEAYEPYASASYGNSVKDARFLSPEKIVAVLPGNKNGEPYLAEVRQGGITEIATDANCSHLALIADDIYFGADDFDEKTWILRSGRMSTPEENESNKFVINDDNTIAQGEDNHEVTTSCIFASAAMEPGKSVGLFHSGFAGSGIAEYRNGRWLLVSLTPDLLVEDHPKPWVDPEGNVTAVGEDSIVRFAGGRLGVENISVSGQEIQSRSIAAVWGHDLDHYWVADRRGNVYAHKGGSWRLAIRGPALGEDEIFEDVWPTPRGGLIAITKEKVFRLE